MTTEITELLAAVIHQLPGNIAVLDEQGVIRAVNANWERFAAANGVHAVADVGPGVSYLEVCHRAEESGDVIAGEIGSGLAKVLSGAWQTFHSEYPCHSSEVQRWFDLYASALSGAASGAVVCHTNITVEWRARRLLHTVAAEPAKRLPVVTMCSGCKRIRDEKLQWQAIEDLLYEQHGERFSHGMCSECIERLYPGVLSFEERNATD